MQAGAVATKGVLGDACAAGYRERSGMAYGCARVPEVLSAVELEGFFAGFVPELFEPALGASMGEEVEEAQELAVDSELCLPLQLPLVINSSSSSSSSWMRPEVLITQGRKA